MRAMTDRRREKIEKILSQRQKDLTLVLANIHDPHNVSAIYRSCDAFGVSKVHLYYTSAVFPLLSKKTSASARKWVETIRHDSKESLIQALKQGGYQILATNCTDAAKPMGEYDMTRPTALVMGNEHAGVPEELFGLVDGEVYIPMFGMIQSFNVSVAAALLLGEASRQRQAAGMYDNKTFSDAEYAEKLAEWLEK